MCEDEWSGKAGADSLKNVIGKRHKKRETEKGERHTETDKEGEI